MESEKAEKAVAPHHMGIRRVCSTCILALYSNTEEFLCLQILQLMSWHERDGGWKLTNEHLKQLTSEFPESEELLACLMGGTTLSLRSCPDQILSLRKETLLACRRGVVVLAEACGE